MNWRKPLIFTLLHLSRSKIPKYLKEIEEIEFKSQKEIKLYQEDKLKKLLIHAWKNVPYYTKVLEESKVVVNGKINLRNFNKIPILTKEIIRKHGKDLYSIDYKKRGATENTSGGSTGESVKFLQDKTFNDYFMATAIHFFRKSGKIIGEKEIKLWGSDRDIILGNLSILDRIKNFIYNREFFNTYDFSKERMLELVKMNNSIKPKSYWAYVDAITEFSKFVIDNKIKLESPNFIITTIGPLYPEARKIISKAFGCPVYNQYGSKEVDGIASQTKEDNELDVFFWKQFIELLPQDKKRENKIIVTSLSNYSMPLIRYEIGDVAIAGSKFWQSENLKSYLSLKNVVGRTLGFFKKSDGSLVHTHFLVQQMFSRNWIRRFQIIQTDFDKITCKIELLKKENENQMIEIEKTFKILLGSHCKIKWEFVKEIKPTKSGKYLYTLSKIK